MLKVALTGGIATGKSYVLRRLADRGIPVMDADILARIVVRPGTTPWRSVRERFGEQILFPDGTIRRDALGAIVFDDAQARRDLEAIVHPAVYAEIARWFAGLEARRDVPMGVADIPLLFETGHERDFDRVIVTACTPDEQLRRLMARDGLTAPDARTRLAAQLPIEEKVARAHHVIRTDGSFEETERQIEEVLVTLRE